MSIQRLVQTDGGLDLNSVYCYLLLCSDFSHTSLVATTSVGCDGRAGEELLGFVAAYRPPLRPDSVFVWQIGVARKARRRGLARQLLLRLLSMPACQAARYLEATVTPSNVASQQLFAGIAAELGGAFECGSGFASELFGGAASPGGQAHEAEERIRIGPLARPVGHEEERRNHERRNHENF